MCIPSLPNLSRQFFGSVESDNLPLWSQNDKLSYFVSSLCSIVLISCAFLKYIDLYCLSRTFSSVLSYFLNLNSDMGNLGVRAQTTTHSTLHLLTRSVPKVMILNAISSVDDSSVTSLPPTIRTTQSVFFCFELCVCCVLLTDSVFFH